MSLLALQRMVPRRAGQRLKAGHLVLGGRRCGGEEQGGGRRPARRHGRLDLSGSGGRRPPEAAGRGGATIPGHMEVLRVVHTRVEVDGHHADPGVGQNGSHLLCLRRVVEAEIVTPAQTYHATLSQQRGEGG